MNIKTIITGVLIILALGAQSQENAKNVSKQSNIDLGVDLVSSYIFRGMQFDAAPNLQGWAVYSNNSLLVGAWMSSNYMGSFTETDLFASYSFENITTQITHFFIGNNNMFEFNPINTSHYGELSLSYTISETLPLSISVGTFIYGGDAKIESVDNTGTPVLAGKNNYSTYFELKYLISAGNTQINLVAGGVTHESYLYGTGGFAIINAGFDISKEVSITQKFSIPVTLALTINPVTESVYPSIKLSF